MGILFQDDFSAYPPGQTVPFGSWQGAGTVVNGDSPNPCPNGQCVQAVDMWVFLNPMGSGVINCGFSIGYGAAKLGGDLIIISNSNATPPPNSKTVFFRVFLEQDWSISLIGPAGYMTDPTTSRISNTMLYTSPPPFGLPGIPFGVPGGPCWMYFTLTFNMMGTDNIQIGCNLVINGGQSIVTGSQTTGINETDTWLGSPQVNQFEILGSADVPGNFANFAIQTEGSGYPNPTNPPNYVHARCSQLAAELLYLPQTTAVNARASQLVVETLSLPNPPQINARASQLAIELLAGQPASPGGVVPQYIKRHNSFAND
jgi:hypothetical protein